MRKHFKPFSVAPDIYFFNPTCEPAIANGSPYYTAPALLRKFESDLGYLPGWLGAENDQVMVKGNVDQSFQDKMNTLGFRLPQFLKLEKSLSDPEWLSFPKGRLCPWGWSPAVYQLFKDVLPTCTDDFQHSAIARWLPQHKNLYSRLTAVGLLEKTVRNGSNTWLPGSDDLPIVCNSHEQIYAALDLFAQGVVKSPWSSSGRGLLIFPNVDTKKKNDELISGMLNQQGFVTVEPWLNKVLDLSYQFTSLAGKIRYMGRSLFETDRKGRYIRNFLTDNPKVRDEVWEFLEEHNRQVVDWLSDGLSQSHYAALYEGWIGVDAMIYRSAEGNLKFHPMVEINGRYTMGAVAMKMREYLAPGSRGFMQLFFSKSGNFQSYCQKQQAAMPLMTENQKIISGFMPLTPPLPEHHFGAYIEVKS
jgi:hypothetical protein